ncbi:MAG TPA: pyruvate:ferredoxin (flavodoxin) oxidoreductase [Chitinispirillaceae bacterium]|nr:pyruvate:ferredoxin (flavodoxin) oxidoreductase [Chitinispirillaceae bacterium]
MKTLDGNEAAAYVAYNTNEAVAIYPITPASPMGEMADLWATRGEKNMWGTVPHIVEMQSEAGAIAAAHGALQRGALTTTFTASQGLLLMIPNMFKIAGELNPMVIHVAARTVATHALSIFCDHSDVMAARSTGFAFLCSASVQEAQDFALISQAATLKSRVPFLHFFDGFRTSHEISKIHLLTTEQLKAMIDDNLVREFRYRALSPERPVIRGTSQNPDIFFQAREASNPFYSACPSIVEQAMGQFGAMTGRIYKLFDYYGDPDAELVIVIMGSASQTVEETVDYLNSRNQKVGLIRVRLYRPFSSGHFLQVLPLSVKSIAVLDRTKEPGAIGEPLYCDVVASINEAAQRSDLPVNKIPRIVGGRYGLSSKEFIPSMVESVFASINSQSAPSHFTVGIRDDVSYQNLTTEKNIQIEPVDRIRALFYGYGSDGTVSANKNTLKIIGEQTDYFVQGYFVYDSMKAGSITVSHLRFDKRPIRSQYQIYLANFIACHQFSFLQKLNMLQFAEDEATFLLNCPYTPDEIWGKLPVSVQKTIITKKLKVYTIDAGIIASKIGLGRRINTIMQTCFFALSKIVPEDTAVSKIKQYVKDSYGKRGDAIVFMNLQAIDSAIENLHRLEVPAEASSSFDLRDAVSSDATAFVKMKTERIIRGCGDELPVSAFDPDGTFPSATSRYLKRGISREIPVWEPDLCIQCGRCSFLCPHAVVRAKVYEKEDLAGAPESFQSVPARHPSLKGQYYTVAVSPQDCTGCRVCVEVCPGKDRKEPKKKALNMQPKGPVLESSERNWEFFRDLPQYDKSALTVREMQFVTPLFEFSGACAGCGETPYLSLLSRLYGDRALIANATGCSSIYGGNEPVTPWAVDKEGRGPAWSNSLFEDNAEFGLGFRIAIDKQIEQCKELLYNLEPEIGTEIIEALLRSEQKTSDDIQEQRNRVTALRERLRQINKNDALDLLALSDSLIAKSIWLVGGDGWAYDIGFGGLDHVLSLGRKVNILVMDTEMYSNTGGQMSKATPVGAVAKFASGGKENGRKDLVMMAMSYGTVYVARVAMGADQAQAIKAFIEADQYEGTSIIVAYAQCIGQGFELVHGTSQQQLAVKSGYWPLLRYNPGLLKEGKNPLQLDSSAPSVPLEDYIYNETRYSLLLRSDPDRAARLLKKAKEELVQRWNWYQYWAGMPVVQER